MWIVYSFLEICNANSILKGVQLFEYERFNFKTWKPIETKTTTKNIIENWDVEYPNGQKKNICKFILNSNFNRTIIMSIPNCIFTQFNKTAKEEIKRYEVCLFPFSNDICYQKSIPPSDLDIVLLRMRQHYQ